MQPTQLLKYLVVALPMLTAACTTTTGKTILRLLPMLEKLRLRARLLATMVIQLK